MSINREDALVAINSYYTIAYDAMLSVYDYNDQALAFALSGDFTNAFVKMHDAMSWAATSLYYIIGKRTPFEGGYAVPYFLEHFAGGDFSMDTLLTTMLEANPDQTLYFIGLVDAFRTSVWNRDFNEEYFAALARGFMEWP